MDPHHPAAGRRSGPFPAYAPGSHEFVLVEPGQLRLEIGAGDVTLRAGESVYFPADVTHRYANRGAVPCVYCVAALIMRPRGSGPRQRAG